MYLSHVIIRANSQFFLEIVFSKLRMAVEPEPNLRFQRFFIPQTAYRMSILHHLDNVSGSNLRSYIFKASRRAKTFTLNF